MGWGELEAEGGGEGGGVIGGEGGLFTSGQSLAQRYNTTSNEESRRRGSKGAVTFSYSEARSILILLRYTTTTIRVLLTLLFTVLCLVENITCEQFPNKRPLGEHLGNTCPAIEYYDHMVPSTTTTVTTIPTTPSFTNTPP